MFMLLFWQDAVKILDLTSRIPYQWNVALDLDSFFTLYDQECANYWVWGCACIAPLPAMLSLRPCGFSPINSVITSVNSRIHPEAPHSTPHGLSLALSLSCTLRRKQTGSDRPHTQSSVSCSESACATPRCWSRGKQSTEE